ncbi:MAG: hypothetical protein AAFO93_04130 [Pseudomonadota bacterium]
MSAAWEYTVALIGPAVILGALGWFVPTYLGRILPETLWGLGLNLVVSWILLTGFAIAVFAIAYWAEGAPANLVLSRAGLAQYAGSARISAIVWGPLLLLALAIQPQRWRPREM